MSDKPAFPVTAGNQVFTTGMTLRDWFAGMALQSAWEALDKGYYESDQPNSSIAAAAYQLADAMLAEREKTNDH